MKLQYQTLSGGSSSHLRVADLSQLLFWLSAAAICLCKTSYSIWRGSELLTLYGYSSHEPLNWVALVGLDGAIFGFVTSLGILISPRGSCSRRLAIVTLCASVSVSGLTVAMLLGTIREFGVMYGVAYILALTSCMCGAGCLVTKVPPLCARNGARKVLIVSMVVASGGFWLALWFCVSALSPRWRNVAGMTEFGIVIDSSSRDFWIINGAKIMIALALATASAAALSLRRR